METTEFKRATERFFISDRRNLWTIGREWPWLLNTDSNQRNEFLPDRRTKRKRKEVILNLGCGKNKFPECVNIDKNPLVRPDINFDLALNHWPFSSDSIDEIRANRVIEQIPNLCNFFNECWRILKKDGPMFVKTFHYKSVRLRFDPLNGHGFSRQCFDFFNEQSSISYKNLYTDKMWYILEYAEDGDYITVTMSPAK